MTVLHQFVIFLQRLYSSRQKAEALRVPWGVFLIFWKLPVVRLASLFSIIGRLIISKKIIMIVSSHTLWIPLTRIWSHAAYIIISHVTSQVEQLPFGREGVPVEAWVTKDENRYTQAAVALYFFAWALSLKKPYIWKQEERVFLYVRGGTAAADVKRKEWNTSVNICLYSYTHIDFNWEEKQNTSLNICLFSYTHIDFSWVIDIFWYAYTFWLLSSLFEILYI